MYMSASTDIVDGPVITNWKAKLSGIQMMFLSFKALNDFIRLHASYDERHLYLLQPNETLESNLQEQGCGKWHEATTLWLFYKDRNIENG